MGFLLVVLSFVVAEEVIELEPVTDSSTNVYGCNEYKTEGNCDGDPYCYWADGATASGKKCIDDPCLKYKEEATGTCAESTPSIDGGVGVVTCEKRTVANFANHDCSGVSGSGTLCAQKVKNKSSLYTYCEYTQLKDGSCPDSICQKYLGSTSVEKHCVKNNVGLTDSAPCHGLTESDCKLVPKCHWKDKKCDPDYCFQKAPTITTCDGLTSNALWTGIAFAQGTCTDWHPLSYDDGSVLDYCISKDNAEANICYFGIANISNTAHTNDFPYDYSPNWRSSSDPGTYPTYNYGSTNPDCSTDALSHCEGHGECKTIVNQKGAFAGRYCTDGKHAAANILRIPSLLVLLGVSALVAVFKF